MPHRFALAFCLVVACGSPAAPPTTVTPPVAPHEPPAPATVVEAPPAPVGPPTPLTLRAMHLLDHPSVADARLPVTHEDFAGDGYRMRIDLVQLPDAAATAALSRVLHERVERFAGPARGYIDTHGACAAMLTHARLVSWDCSVSYRDDADTTFHRRTYLLLGIGEHGEIFDVEREQDLFVDRQRVEELAADTAQSSLHGSQFYGFGASSGITTRGLAWMFHPIGGGPSDAQRTVTVPWSSLTQSIDADGPLASLFPDAPIEDVLTSIPSGPLDCAFVVTDPLPYAELAARARRLPHGTRTWAMPVDASRGRLVAPGLRSTHCATTSPDAEALAATNDAVAHAVATAGLPHVVHATTSRAAMLRAAPSEDAERLASIPRGVDADVFYGRLPGPRRSASGEGTWAFLTVAGLAGWVRGDGLGPATTFCDDDPYGTAFVGHASAGRGTPYAWRATRESNPDRTRLVVARAAHCDPLGPSSFDQRIDGDLFDLAFPRGNEGGLAIVLALTLARGAATPTHVHVAAIPFGASTPAWSADVPLAAVRDMQLEVGTGEAYRAFVLATDPPTRVSVHEGVAVVD